MKFEIEEEVFELLSLDAQKAMRKLRSALHKAAKDRVKKGTVVLDAYDCGYTGFDNARLDEHGDILLESAD